MFLFASLGSLWPSTESQYIVILIAEFVDQAHFPRIAQNSCMAELSFTPNSWAQMNKDYPSYGVLWQIHVNLIYILACQDPLIHNGGLKKNACDSFSLERFTFQAVMRLWGK